MERRDGDLHPSSQSIWTTLSAASTSLFIRPRTSPEMTPNASLVVIMWIPGFDAIALEERKVRINEPLQALRKLTIAFLAAMLFTSPLFLGLLLCASHPVLATPLNSHVEPHKPHITPCFPALDFKMPDLVPKDNTDWWCDPSTEYAFVGFSYEVTACEKCHSLCVNKADKRATRSNKRAAAPRVLRYTPPLQQPLCPSIWRVRSSRILVRSCI